MGGIQQVKIRTGRQPIPNLVIAFIIIIIIDVKLPMFCIMHKNKKKSFIRPKK